MKKQRIVYKIAAIIALVACIAISGVAASTGDVAVALAGAAGAGAVVMLHLNHLSCFASVTNLKKELAEDVATLDSIVSDLTKDFSLLSAQGRASQEAVMSELQLIAGEDASRTESVREGVAGLHRILGERIDRVQNALDMHHTQFSESAKDIVRRTKLAGNAIASLQQASESYSQDHRRRSDIRHSALRVQMERIPSDVVGLAGISAKLLDGNSSVPMLGGWAVSASTIVAMLCEVLARPSIETIVECGSGASTVWFGLACKARGHGHVYALEHDAGFAEATRQHLQAHGLVDWVTVIDAPLRFHQIDGAHYEWYSLEGLDKVESIDLLFIDGPPESTGKNARYPAFPLLADRISVDAWVVLDDTVRREERDIASRWCSGVHCGIKLIKLYELPKSCVMVATG